MCSFVSFVVNAFGFRLLAAKPRQTHFSPTGVKAFKNTQRCVLFTDKAGKAQRLACRQPVAYSALRVQAFPDRATLDRSTDAALGLSKAYIKRTTVRLSSGKMGQRHTDAVQPTSADRDPALYRLGTPFLRSPHFFLRHRLCLDQPPHDHRIFVFQPSFDSTNTMSLLIPIITYVYTLKQSFENLYLACFLLVRYH